MATLSEDEIRRLHIIMKTVMEMLRDRGYEVADDEVEMTRAKFIATYGENMKRGDLTIIKSTSNSSDQIYVFFPDEREVKVATIRPYVTKMKDDKVNRAILVVQENPTTFVRTCISGMSTKLHLEVFKEDELLVNVKNHVLVPKHQIISPEEKQSLLEKYKVKETQIPWIKVTDPIARYYGMKPGQFVKIIRSSEVAGNWKYVTYRRVV